MTSYKTSFGSVYVVDEGARFKYGTKQRVAEDYIRHFVKQGYREFIYAGPVDALGAFALAWGCVQNNVRATLFLVGARLSPQAKGFNSSVKIKLMHCSLLDATQTAQKYVDRSTKRLLIPFGGLDPLYTRLLKTSLESDPAALHCPKRMWIAVGSGTILSVLLQLYPQTEFHAVQVGKSLHIDKLSDDPDTVDEYRKRIVLYRAPERFAQPAQYPPPYSSLINYDAKLWRFVLSDGQDGDFIWNVARDF